MSIELDINSKHKILGDSKHKILGDRYYLHNVITQSNYSRIFLATDLAIDYRRCAIKQLYPRYCLRKMQAKIETEFLREVDISRQIAGIHPQLCRHYNYLVDSGNQYLVQEWIEGTTLSEKLQQQKKLTESETQAILSNILIILERLHDLKIVHNDLKPSNIILRSEESTQFIQPTITEIINNSLQKVIFFPGTDAEKILQTLGEPLWRKPGFWANSIAWFYEDVIEEEIDLGYIFDRQTNKLRQAEIAVPPQTHLSTLQSAMNLFLAAEQSSTAIERGLEAVYRREKKMHNFKTENLQGIIQRNDQDRIYLAVWSADFH